MTWGDFLVAYEGRVLYGESLAKRTTLRVGGSAGYLFEAKTSEEVVVAVTAAVEGGVRYVVLGGGTNTLFSDAGFDGLVVIAANRGVTFLGPDTQGRELVRAEAGVVSAALARQLVERGFAGFAWAASLPGTIGGAVRGNAGCFGGEIKNTVVSVEVLHGGRCEMLDAVACHFGYRNSVFKCLPTVMLGEATPIDRTPDVILAATFAFTPSSPEACRAQMVEVLEKRKKMQPAGVASAGCMFKNFEIIAPEDVDKLARTVDVPTEFLAKRIIPAGWLIDQADLKGFSIGHAAVSAVHGNFLTTAPGATADEIIQLIAAITTKIRNQFGIQLQEEVQLY